MAGVPFNIGSDAKLTILINGAPFGASVLTNFESKQLTTRLTSKPVNGDPNFREVEEGWEGTAEYDRANSIVDDFFVQKEAARYAGQQPPQIVLTHAIVNPDGSTSRYRFEGVAVKLDEAGSYKSDDKVMQKIGWVASRRKAA